MGLIKLAGLFDGIGKGLLAAGKSLMTNNTIKNAAIGAGVGAISGAVAAPKGDTLKGALKGAATGGLVGGATTAGMNIYKNMKPEMGSGMSFVDAVKNEGNLLKNTVSQANWIGKNTKAVAAGTASALPNSGIRV
jgi:hypothetical protein